MRRKAPKKTKPFKPDARVRYERLYPVLVEEIQDLCMNQGVDIIDLVCLMKYSRPSFYRHISGRVRMHREFLIDLGEVLPGFNVDKWLIYFGWLPRNVANISAHRPDEVLKALKRVFKEKPGFDFSADRSG